MTDGARSSRTLTLVFTDLANSTALKTERGDQAVGDLIAQHRGLVQKLAADSGGRIIDWAGDGCFLTFDAPSAAVLFALRLQRAHGEEPDLPGIRIGMHMGEVTEGPSPAGDGPPRVEGLAVDLAARISSLARPGQVLMSSAVYDSARPRLGANAFGRPVRWQMHGGYALKGFDKALEVGEAGLEGIAPFEAPAASDKVTPLRAPGVSTPAPPARTRTRSVVVAMMLIAALSLAAAYLLIRRPGPDGGAARTPITSLAVLPFKNFSGDREQDYFVDGMTEALISELAKIKSIKVISRTSAMLYKGTEKPLPQVARELGVDGLIEGSVYRGGEDVRISAQLIRGATDEHLWSESYTETLANVLRLQAKVALAISREIQATLSPEDQRRLASARPVVPEAHAALLKGIHFFNEATPEAFEQAGRYFREAVRHDPTYAPAYAWLANVYWLPATLGFAQAADFVVARALANEALRLDPESADAHTTIAWLAAVSEWEWARSEAEFRRAIALDPSSGWGYLGLSDLLADIGRFDDGIAAAKAALERDPLSPFNLWQVAYLQFMARHYETALKEYQRLFQLAPDFTVALSGAADTYWWAGRNEEALRLAGEAVTRDVSPTNRAYLAYMLALSGRREEAERALEQAVDEGERSYVVPACVAWALSALGDRDGAFRWLDRGLDERDYSMLQLKTQPNYDPLRSDPRFQTLLHRMKFPE